LVPHAQQALVTLGSLGHKALLTQFAELGASAHAMYIIEGMAKADNLEWMIKLDVLPAAPTDAMFRWAQSRF